ncbi:MAG: NAD(P)H-hydrate epimerase [Planctomycetota bacterium]|nr:MAG: NAD(P)H-hydrate epimerase [Planctomycetota bacterium]
MTPIEIDLAASPFRAPVLTRRQVRELDRRAVDELGVSSLVLMENAGRGAADVLCSLSIAGPVVVCCGKGNNAGDGFVVARHLELRNHAVRVLAWSKRGQLSPDAAANAAILERAGVRIDWRLDDDAAATSQGHNDGRLDANLAAALVGAAWVIDALLGTGATGLPRPPIDGVIRQINASGLPVFALDLPSGLDCDTGDAADPTIRAAHTCTFAALKPGLIAAAAAPYVGQLHLTDIGINVGHALRA